MTDKYMTGKGLRQLEMSQRREEAVSDRYDRERVKTAREPRTKTRTLSRDYRVRCMTGYRQRPRVHSEDTEQPNQSKEDPLDI